jgi:hypothetical protein
MRCMQIQDSAVLVDIRHHMRVDGLYLMQIMRAQRSIHHTESMEHVMMQSVYNPF